MFLLHASLGSLLSVPCCEMPFLWGEITWLFVWSQVRSQAQTTAVTYLLGLGWCGKEHGVLVSVLVRLECQMVMGGQQH